MCRVSVCSFFVFFVMFDFGIVLVCLFVMVDKEGEGVRVVLGWWGVLGLCCGFDMV